MGKVDISNLKNYSISDISITGDKLTESLYQKLVDLIDDAKQRSKIPTPSQLTKILKSGLNIPYVPNSIKQEIYKMFIDSVVDGKFSKGDLSDIINNYKQKAKGSNKVEDVVKSTNMVDRYLAYPILNKRIMKNMNFSRKSRDIVRNTAITAGTIGTLYGAKKLRDHVTAVDYDKNIMVTKPSDGIEKFDMNNVEIKPQQGVMDALNANAEKLIPTHNKVPFAPSINKTVDLKTLGITQPVQSTENETNEIDNINELNEVSPMEFSNITDKKELAKKVAAGLGAGALAVGGLGAGVVAAGSGYLNKATSQYLSDQELKNEAIRAIHRSPELYSQYRDIYEKDPHKLDSFYKEVLNMPESERGYVINENLVPIEFSKKFKANFGREKKKDNYLAEKIIGGLGGAAIIGGGIGSYKGLKGTLENSNKILKLEEEAGEYDKQYSKDPINHFLDTVIQYGKENKGTPEGTVAYDTAYALKYGRKPNEFNSDNLSPEEEDRVERVLEEKFPVNYLENYIKENPKAIIKYENNLKKVYGSDEEDSKQTEDDGVLKNNFDPVVEYFYSDVNSKRRKAITGTVAGLGGVTALGLGGKWLYDNQFKPLPQVSDHSGLNPDDGGTKF